MNALASLDPNDSDLGMLARLRHDPRRAIGEHAIVCLICGRAMRQLTNTHLKGHGVTAAEYRRDFGYNTRRPLMCHALRRLYSERSVQVNLAARIRERPIVIHPELRTRGGRRVLSREEILTRAEARARAREAREARKAPPVRRLRARERIG